MFEQTISKETAKSLALLGKSKILKDAYLAGGTALALQIGHRISYDLDFFTDQKFKTHSFLEKIGKFKNYKHEQTSWQTVLGRLGDVKFSLFYYGYPILKNPSVFKGVKIASIPDISAMKISAICERGTKRDFVDLYFILQEISIDKIFKYYDKKFKRLAVNIIHIKKSLVYFVDAENEPMPMMLKEVEWADIKKYFKKLAKLTI